MSHPIPSGQKSAFIAIVNASPEPGGADEAVALATILNNFEDLPTAIGRQLDLFAANNSYLTECMAVFLPNDADLVSVGIFNAKSGGTPLVDPLLIINSNMTGGVTITANSNGLGLLGASRVNNITVNTMVDLQNLYIGPGCTVDLLDSNATKAFVNNIWLPFLKSTPSILTAARYGSSIGAIRISEGSYYGGILNINPDLACAAGPVTGLVAGDITHNSIVLTWSLPGGGFIFINIQYKKTESAVWLSANSDTGEYIQQAGYVFRELEADTYYDFRVQTVCSNGGVAYATISAQTVCCGSGGETLVADCLVTVYIKTSPDSTKKIALCNGVMIAQEYPEGPTLTIPELAGRRLASDVIISNIPYQAIPFNQTLFQFDLSTTPLLRFEDPNIVSFEVRLPL